MHCIMVTLVTIVSVVVVDSTPLTRVDAMSTGTVGEKPQNVL